jgi:hypothetical protein
MNYCYCWGLEPYVFRLLLADVIGIVRPCHFGGEGLAFEERYSITGHELSGNAIGNINVY